MLINVRMKLTAANPAGGCAQGGSEDMGRQ
jgi:hypothetical protein